MFIVPLMNNYELLFKKLPSLISSQKDKLEIKSKWFSF